MKRALLAAVGVALAWFGAMQTYSAVIEPAASPSAFILGIGVACLAGALFCFVEFVRS